MTRATPTCRTSGSPSARGTSPPRDIYSLGVLVAQALTGLRGDVAESGSTPASVPRVIDRATDVDATSRYQTFVDVFDGSARDARRGHRITGQPSRPGGTGRQSVQRSAGVRRCRCRRLLRRERLVERLVARLGQPGTRGRFFAVVGPSGSGKSSVVKAGLLAAIRRGAVPMSGSWFTIEMTPAPHPFEELEDALPERRRRSARLAARTARRRARVCTAPSTACCPMTARSCCS